MTKQSKRREGFEPSYCLDTVTLISKKKGVGKQKGQRESNPLKSASSFASLCKLGLFGYDISIACTVFPVNRKFSIQF